MKIVFYDTETSGTEHYRHEIIQIAAVAFEIGGDDWEELDTFECKMRFDVKKADPTALAMNCYDEDLWHSEAVSQSQGLQEFDRFVAPFKDVARQSKGTGNVARQSKGTGKTFCCLRTGGHNILKFDDAFVRAWYKRQDAFCPFDFQEAYDTLQLAKWKLSFGRSTPPENLRLETLCGIYGVDLTGAHDALADVTANARLAWHLTRPE